MDRIGRGISDLNRRARRKQRIAVRRRNSSAISASSCLNCDLRFNADNKQRLFVVVVEQVAEVFLLTAVVVLRCLSRGCGGRLNIVVIESAWSFFSSIFTRSFLNQTTHFVGQGIFVWHDSTRRTVPFTAHWNRIANTVFASILIRV